jgi:hypothetical protein
VAIPLLCLIASCSGIGQKGGSKQVEASNLLSESGLPALAIAGQQDVHRQRGRLARCAGRAQGRQAVSPRSHVGPDTLQVSCSPALLPMLAMQCAWQINCMGDISRPDRPEQRGVGWIEAAPAGQLLASQSAARTIAVNKKQGILRLDRPLPAY